MLKDTFFSSFGTQNYKSIFTIAKQKTIKIRKVFGLCTLAKQVSNKTLRKCTCTTDMCNSIPLHTPPKNKKNDIRF